MRSGCSARGTLIDRNTAPSSTSAVDGALFLAELASRCFRPRVKTIAACIALAFVLVPALATADEAPQQNVVQLAQAIEDQAAALSTDDCTTACKALASMQRAADRLCKMDPGPSCTKARATVDSATRRVRDACPTCASALAPNEPPPPPPAQTDERTKGEEVATQAAPPAESRRGGCAGCDAGGGPPASDATLIAFAWLMTRARRKRRRRDAK